MYLSPTHVKNYPLLVGVGLHGLGSGLDPQYPREYPCPTLDASGNQDFYLEKIRVFKAGLCLNTLAWNNRIGCVVLFCWFLELL
jgi:hypothetical protein